MPRFFKEYFENDPVITGGDAFHIAKTLRMRPGERIVVCDTRGGDYLCRILTAEPDKVTLAIEKREDNATEPRNRVTLFTSLLKGDAFDSVIREAVELGAAVICPVLSARCVSRPDRENDDRRQTRRRKIAAEAAGQSGRGIIPEVTPVITLNELAAGLPRYDKALFFYELGGCPPDEIKFLAGENIAVITGCEGGFDRAEADMIISAGGIPVTLGPRILRAETAPVAALSVVMLLSGNMQT